MIQHSTSKVADLLATRVLVIHGWWFHPRYGSMVMLWSFVNPHAQGVKKSEKVRAVTSAFQRNTDVKMVPTFALMTMPR